VPSTRRNPVIAEVFHRLDFIERRGSGLKKIRNETANLYGYKDELAPRFESTRTAFHVTFKNMNYNLREAEEQDVGQAAREYGEEMLEEESVSLYMEIRLKPIVLSALIDFCAVARTRKQMQEFCGIKSDEYFRKHIVVPMLGQGIIKRTIPDKPNSRNQKYISTKIKS
jgi:ATP-dependent DNA helicase RecG